MKGGQGRGEKIQLPDHDIIDLLGNSVCWQTELLIGAAQGKQIDDCQLTASLYCLFCFHLHATAERVILNSEMADVNWNFNSAVEASLLELEQLGNYVACITQ